MLQLLSLNQAVILILHWNKKWDDPFDPEAFSKIQDDKELYRNFWFVHAFIINAIEAEKLPALAKPLSKPEERKRYDAVNVPDEIRNHLPKQCTYWITLTDLLAFYERADSVARSIYSHSREAIARAAWMLALRAGVQNDSESLFTYLEHIEDELSSSGVQAKLGETTLRGCVREILAAGEGLKAADT